MTLHFHHSSIPYLLLGASLKRLRPLCICCVSAPGKEQIREIIGS